MCRVCHLSDELWSALLPFLVHIFYFLNIMYPCLPYRLANYMYDVAIVVMEVNFVCIKIVCTETDMARFDWLLFTYE